MNFGVTLQGFGAKCVCVCGKDGWVKVRLGMGTRKEVGNISGMGTTSTLLHLEPMRHWYQNQAALHAK